MAHRVGEAWGVVAGLVALMAFALEAQGEPLWREAGPKAGDPVSRATGHDAALHGARRSSGGASLPAFHEVIARAQKAVASISTLERTSGQNPLSGVVPAPIDAEQQKGLGSGFFIHPDGYLVTNAHVVEDVLGIRVFIPREGGWREFPARVLGLDRFTDVALLKVDGGNHAFETLPLGDSDALEVAEWVAAIGNPFGLRHSVSVGVVSFKGRNDVRPAGREGYFDYLQTDAAINPGNSGGPLINQRGEVIGIANAVNAVGQGIGFAIPINLAKAVLYPLLRDGTVRRGWLGIRVDSLTPALARSLELSAEQRGVVVSQVLSGTPGERAGLRKGDLITIYDGQRVDDAQALRWRASLGEVGGAVSIEVLRAGQPQRLTIELSDAPEQSAALWKGAHASLGIIARTLNVPKARREGLSVPFGAEVVEVRQGSRAERGGLIVGDVLLKVDETLLIEPLNLAALFDKPEAEGARRVVVRRSGETIFLSL
ncbi:MAG: trypsin-like peptidase domain-containing protein [Myxococcaceae bacterium]|nr:trypsin-like peptidase domain-containing protein [Myxococcaceae bacterium]